MELAAEWTENYRNQLTDSGEARSHFFGREILERLLAQEKCVGIRMYYGLELPAGEGAKKQLILVGVDENGNDLEDLVADRSTVCPPECIVTGVLSGGS